MKGNVTINIDTVSKLAQLAKLQLTEEEKKTLSSQLDETIRYVENLNELQTDDLKETAHNDTNVNVYFEDGKENTRSFSNEDALKNAKRTKNNCFVVEKIM